MFSLLLHVVKMWLCIFSKVSYFVLALLGRSLRLQPMYNHLASFCMNHRDICGLWLCEPHCEQAELLSSALRLKPSSCTQ